jgi:hypothetical protein
MAAMLGESTVAYPQKQSWRAALKKQSLLNAGNIFRSRTLVLDLPVCSQVKRPCYNSMERELC